MLDYKNFNVLIIGGDSDVAQSLAKNFAKLGSDLIITSRRINDIESFRSDLEIRYSISCETLFFDAQEFEKHKKFYENINKKPDIVISCIGYLNLQDSAENSFTETLKSFNANFIGLVSIINIIANDFEKKKAGTIIGISSVAGDRGIKSNYIYGSSKAGYSTYLSGLRARLNISGVRVITVKPGFIYSKMTNHLDLPKILTAKADEVATSIINAINKSNDIIYIKPIWRWIMLFIRCLPEFIFKKIKF